jgi:mevalonate kinase
VGAVTRAEGKGRGKLLLFGEHAAVYGHPAVGLSLPESIRAEVALGGGEGWRFPRALPEERERLCLLLERFRRIIPGLEQARGGELVLVSDIPRGQGFGSSAALCAAVAAALCSALGRGEPLEGIWAYAHEAERLFHGTPSGIDTGLALLAGLYLFRPDPPRLPAARRLPGRELPLVVGALPRRAETGELIRRLRERMEAGQRRTARLLGELGDIARRSGELLEDGPQGPAGERLALLGELAWQAQERLAALKLSTPELDALLEQGRRAGALGGKLSGAGGGGAFYLIFAEPQAALAAAGLLRAAAGSRMPAAAETIRALLWPWPTVRSRCLPG